MYYIYGISGPSLLIESTDSMIINSMIIMLTTLFEVSPRGNTASLPYQDSSSDKNLGWKCDK